MQTEKTKVLAVLDHLKGGGAQEHLYQLSKQLDNNQIEIMILSFWGGSYEQRFQALGKKVFLISEEKKSFLRSVKAFFFLRQYLNNQQYDVLHTFLPGSFLFVALIHLFQKREKKTWVHSILATKKQPPFWYFFLMKRMQRLVDVIISANPKDIENNFRDENIKYAEVILDLSMPTQDEVDEASDFLKKRGITDKDSLILSVGRLHKEKGHDLVIKALPLILQKKANVKLLILGEGSELKKLQNLVVQRHLESSVCFLGYQRNLNAIMQFAEVFVRSSVTEGHNLTTLFAMASTIPIVAFDTGISKDFIVHEQTGWVVPNIDAQMLGDAIADLLENPALMRRLSQKARLSITKYYDIQNIIAFHEHLYIGLANNVSVDQIVDLKTKIWPIYNPFDEGEFHGVSYRETT